MAARRLRRASLAPVPASGTGRPRSPTTRSKPVGDRITSIQVNGDPIDLAKTYSVSTFSFLASGGDNFTAFKDGDDQGHRSGRPRPLDQLPATDREPVSPNFAREQICVPAVRPTATAPVTRSRSSSRPPRHPRRAVRRTPACPSSLGQTALGTFPVDNTIGRPSSTNGFATVPVKVGRPARSSRSAMARSDDRHRTPRPRWLAASSSPSRRWRTRSSRRRPA